MGLNLHYDIKVTLHFNEFDLNTLDPSTLLHHKTVYDVSNIGLFIQTKSLIDYDTPMAQIRLNQIPEDLVTALNANKYILEVAIFQRKVELYRNFYKSVEATIITIETPKGGADLINSDIYMQSLIITKLDQDKTFSSIKLDSLNEIGYVQSKELIFEKLPKALESQYGNSISTYNFCSKNISTTGFKSLLFPATYSNMENIDYVLENYPFTLNPFLYGFDEGFNSSKNKGLCSLIMVDLLEPDLWQHQTDDCKLFEKDPDAISQAQVTVSFDGNYFNNTFSDRYITSYKTVSNTVDGSIYKLDPFSVAKSPKFNSNNSSFPDFASSSIDASSNEQMETTLSKKDFILYMESRIKLYSKKPEVYHYNLTKGAPYDYFRLGRRIDIGPKKHNLLVAADIRFIPDTNPENVQVFKEKSEMLDSFLCTGELQTISYD